MILLSPSLPIRTEIAQRLRAIGLAVEVATRPIPTGVFASSKQEFRVYRKALRDSVKKMKR